MASQFSSNSTHDDKVAKNVSSVLLNSIGSLLRISSWDARIETKDDFTKQTVSKISIKIQKAAEIGPNQEIFKVREWTPHISPLTKVIPLKLFLDMVLSSPVDIIRAMRVQPKRLSRNYLRGNGGNVIVDVLISFHRRDVFCALSGLFNQPSFGLFCAWLAVHCLAVYSVLRPFN